MRTIVVINDNTPYAVRAAEAALIIAQKSKANLLLANMVALNETVKAGVVHGYTSEYENEESYAINLATQLETHQETVSGHKPVITNLDAINLNESELAGLLNKMNVWMLIYGCGDKNTGTAMPLLDPFTLLNIIKCPLVFIPLTCSTRVFEHIVYMTDLRYSQPSVIRYLAHFAKPYASKLMLAHLSASGLPDMAMDYALSLFQETIGPAVSYSQLAFSNIKERDVEEAIDVLIQGMHTDMLVLVNHQYHFKEVVGNFMSSKQLPQLSIPVMIFPF